MSGLLGPNGKPISVQNKKAKPPIMGEKLGSWSGEELRYLLLPGGGAIQFDLSKLTLGDYRQMRDHYQINSSLAVLTFLLHQMEWHIECDDKKVREFCEETLKEVWTRLVRAKSQAFWAGYSPNVLQWENDVEGRRVVLTKVKDLIPEDCSVNWKEEAGFQGPNGFAKPKVKIFDGIRQIGWPYPIPVSNSYWYPLLMENGDYYGKRLLKPAFVPWFFSILLHLFANRYYERFGEPTPIGRAPYDDTVEVSGEQMQGNQAMELILGQVRNRSVVVLPSNRTPVGDETNPEFDYQIEYLESQMRGADFERYMGRLDEEMSLALFTPILLMRTADVGSYNLGVGHMKVYLWMLNAISDDWKTYIDKYILRPMRDYNFGLNAAIPKIKFRRLGVENGELVRDVINAMLGKGEIKLSVQELGEMSGMSIEEVRQVTAPPGEDPDDEPDQAAQEDLQKVADKVYKRTYGQVRNLIENNSFGKIGINFGHQREFENTLVAHGVTDASRRTNTFYAQVENYCDDLVVLGWNDTDKFMKTFKAGLDCAVRGVLN